MSLYRSLAVCFGTAIVSGCAIHPLPENVTGLNTYRIVQQIRCEARSAIKQRAIDVVLASSTPSEARRREIAHRLDQEAEKWETLPLRELDEKTRGYIADYQRAYIYHDFQFTMTEDNDASTDINFSALGVGLTKLNLKAANNRLRANIRAFRVKDTFGSVLKDPDLDCAGTRKGPDYIYPIVGAIGTAEVVRTFTDLNTAQNLSPAGDGKVPILTDTLKFTTAWSVGTTPTLVLSPVGRALSLADASVTTNLKRSDQHQVIIGLFIPEDAPAAKAASPSKAPRFLQRFRSRGSAPATVGDQLDDAINQQLELQYLEGLGLNRSLLLGVRP